ncbi:MAG: 16S rRNA (cytosine(1402)-N(4))-methyltransferase RsmH [Candidatus Kerfeldbacteria bacterium]|nr:16S rRNA (cytosine(1402)-N(4))-methyltransferase RsmH [Candidatus Kerfeldbacteria bacterium]
MSSTPRHIPVLLREVIEHLQLRPHNHVVDATFGGGGYTEAMLESISPDGHVLALDLDSEALERGKRRFAGKPVTFLQTNFSHLKDAVEQIGWEGVNAVVFDLGVSSMQLDTAERGFSFQNDGPLDMRFGTRDLFEPRGQKLTAEQIVNTWKMEDLEHIFREYGEERYARKIATVIVKLRRSENLHTTHQLSKLLESLVPRERSKHPATRVFQALRIAVNQELDHLQKGLEAAVDVLVPGGRLVVVSFHSLEDRIVKNMGKLESRDCICPSFFPECRCQHRARLTVVTKKVVTPTLEEKERNPRARSAKLRVFEKRKR